MFNLSTLEVVLSIEKSPILQKNGIIYQEYHNFFGNNYNLDVGKKENFVPAWRLPAVTSL